MMQNNSKEYNHTNRKLPEFESYNEGYLAGMEDPVKRLLGKSFEDFIEVKVRWLLVDLARNPLNYVMDAADIKLLDFGCGSGELLQTLRKKGFKGKLEGCDVSAGMLKEAAKRWNLGAAPPLHLIREGDKTPFTENSYDIVVVCCVFHHIAPSRHCEAFNDLIRILKPGGRLILFEHNPLNPLTRWIVARTSIDRNAILIRARKILKMMFSTGLSSLRVSYLLFFPPRFRWQWLARVEDSLSWLPLGGQYAVVGEKASLKWGCTA